jgi:hypothetical protein
VRTAPATAPAPAPTAVFSPRFDMPLHEANVATRRTAPADRRSAAGVAWELGTGTGEVSASAFADMRREVFTRKLRRSKNLLSPRSALLSGRLRTLTPARRALNGPADGGFGSGAGIEVSDVRSSWVAFADSATFVTRGTANTQGSPVARRDRRNFLRSVKSNRCV